MSGIAWGTIQTAVHAWVVAGTGLPAGRVIFSGQEGPRPAGAYVALRFTAVRGIGVDIVSVRDAEDPEEGAEIEHRVIGTREVTLEIQCFGGQAPGSGVGTASPVALLADVISAAHLPTRRWAMNAAGVSFLSAGPVQSLDGVLGTSFEPRAVLEARLLVSGELSEFVTFIETVEVTNEVASTVTTYEMESTP